MNGKTVVAKGAPLVLPLEGHRPAPAQGAQDVRQGGRSDTVDGSRPTLALERPGLSAVTSSRGRIPVAPRVRSSSWASVLPVDAQTS